MFKATSSVQFQKATNVSYFDNWVEEPWTLQFWVRKITMLGLENFVE